MKIIFPKLIWKLVKKFLFAYYLWISCIMYWSISVNIPKLSSKKFFFNEFYKQSSICSTVVKRELEANLYLFRLAVLRLWSSSMLPHGSPVVPVEELLAVGTLPLLSSAILLPLERDISTLLETLKIASVFLHVHPQTCNRYYSIPRLFFNIMLEMSIVRKIYLFLRIHFNSYYF